MTDLNEVASANRVEVGSFPCPIASYPKAARFEGQDVHKIAMNWTQDFNSMLSSRQYDDLAIFFCEESYWRDQLCLSWDFHTLKGYEQMGRLLRDEGTGTTIKSVKIDTSAPHRAPMESAVDVYGEHPCVLAFLTIETTLGRGVGLVKLVQDVDGEDSWRAFTLLTTLRELQGYEEATGLRRPQGVEHGGMLGRKNWQDRRNDKQEFAHEDPSVLIVGAGQAGLMIAARLKQLGIESLLIDRNERVGDNWRKRYHQLVLHDPVWYDHMPYLKFPDNWPVFTPKDKLAEWFEIYVKAMELSVWTSTSLSNPRYDQSSQKWSVTLTRIVGGKEVVRVLHPKHIIQATGHASEKNFPAHIKGITDFKGDVLCHSSEFPGAKAEGKGKNAVVVGCCNSGHDIAQDFYENGYNVTMIQRSTTYVMQSKTGIPILMKGLYEEGGPPVDDADIFFMGIPNPVIKRLHQDVTKEIAKKDKDLLEGLAKAGFALDKGPDDAGMFMKYFQRGGGYYIDVGASQLIVDGKIKIKQGLEITTVNPHSITFSDGSELEADEIVFATGYQNMRETTRKIFGDDIADKVNDVWGMDEEGELRTMWRRSGHPRFWFMGGNFALCRFYSRLLALQIKAIEVGLASDIEV